MGRRTATIQATLHGKRVDERTILLDKNYFKCCKNEFTANQIESSRNCFRVTCDHCGKIIEYAYLQQGKVCFKNHYENLTVRYIKNKARLKFI